MNKQAARMMVIALTSVALVAAQEKPVVESAPAADGGGAKPMIDAMAAIGSIIAGADKSVSAETPAADAATENPDQAPASAKAPRSAKNSVILITSGAAAGAAVGAAMGKDSKAAMIGAAVGGVAGLIYDRLTYKNPGSI